MVTPFALILPAAGTGSRMGTRERKTLLRLGGKPVLYHALERFRGIAAIAQVVLVVHPDDLTRYRPRLRALLELGVTDIVPGGERRQDSVELGLAAVRREIRHVAIHDAARPFVSRAVIERTLAAARTTGAAIAGIAVVDTLKQVDGRGRIVATLDRSQMRAVQTPQAFRRDWLEHAYAKARTRGLSVTDDAGLLEAEGHAVVVVEGNAENLKITTPADLAIGRVLLARLRAQEANAARGTRRG